VVSEVITDLIPAGMKLLGRTEGRNLETWKKLWFSGPMN
jgi:hypothetical protein